MRVPGQGGHVAWNPDAVDSVRAAAEGVETIVYTVGVPYDESGFTRS